MTSQVPRLSLALLTLSACSVSSGADEALSVTGGAIELAVSETCVGGSDPQCISLNGENVLLPTTFERASVKDATLADGGAQNAVNVTFNEDGAVVLNAITTKAAEAGDSARLVMKAGDVVIAAVRVMEPLESDHMQITVSPDDSTREIIDLNHEG